MSCNVEKVIATALNEVGYCEKETWNQLDDKYANAGDKNFVKYSRDLAQYSFYNSSKKGVAWCDIFNDWCFYAAYGPNAAKKLLCQPNKSSGAGCKHSANYYKSKGRWHTGLPQAGDQIFFWPKDRTDPEAMQHTGQVIDVDSKYVYTVEGNTSGSSGVIDNGGQVAQKKYRITYERIAGYGRPDYDGVDPDPGYEDMQNGGEKSMKEVFVHSDNGKPVNFRTASSVSASRVAGCPAIECGEKVVVVSQAGEWSLIRYKGFEGYVKTEFLKEEIVSNNSVEDMSAGEIIEEIEKLLARVKYLVT